MVYRQLLMLLFLLQFSSACKKDKSPDENIDYRSEMRSFVIDLSKYSKNINGDFIIIPQNGQELISSNGEGSGTAYSTYAKAIDAVGRENLFYGYNKDDEATPSEDRKHLLDLCLLCEQNNVEVLTTDYCSTHSKMDDSYQMNLQNGFISFAADERELNNIPNYPSPIYNENTDTISDISKAKNFLYLINSGDYDTKQDFINAVSATNYDVIIMDLYHKGQAFTNAEISQLKIKKNGADRLVVCYLSIGEAEDYRYYWKSDWKKNKPEWLDKENPEWAGNYKVKYWNKDWQNIIYGNDNSYLKKALDAGFNGVYLDIIDAFEYYEEK